MLSALGEKCVCQDVEPTLAPGSSLERAQGQLKNNDATTAGQVGAGQPLGVWKREQQVAGVSHEEYF